MGKKEFKLCLVYISTHITTMGGCEDFFYHAPVNILSLSKFIGQCSVNDNYEVTSTLLVFGPDNNHGEILKKINSVNADLIGFSCYAWNIERTMKVAKALSREIGKPIVVGGPEAGSAYDLMSKYPFIDYCVRGEGEEVLYGLIDGLARDGVPPRIQGLIVRNGNEIIDHGGYGMVRDINNLPRIFTKDFISTLPPKTHVVYTSERGCFAGCRFCSCKGTFRRPLVEVVEREIKDIVLSDRVSAISIADPDCSFDIERTKRIISVIEKFNSDDKPVCMFFSFLNIDNELLDMIRRNKISLQVGVQSANEAALVNSSRKSYIVNDSIKNLENSIPELDLDYVSLIFINGLPGDDIESIGANMKWAQFVGSSSMTIFNLQALPGTYFREHAKEFSIKYKSKPHYIVTSSATFSAQKMRIAYSRSFWCQVLFPMFTHTELRMLAEKNIYIWDVARKLPFVGCEDIKKFCITPETGILCLKQRERESLSNWTKTLLSDLSIENSGARAMLEILCDDIKKLETAAAAS